MNRITTIDAGDLIRKQFSEEDDRIRKMWKVKATSVLMEVFNDICRGRRAISFGALSRAGKYNMIPAKY